jgi:8-amino-7-oxononanoate synthase
VSDRPERDPLAPLRAAASRRAEAGLVRTLRPRAAKDGALDLASNDYLGLARHPDVARAAADAALEWGGGATGSRLVTGSTTAHARLEEELASFVGTEAALVFSSGYLANLGAVAALAGRDDLVVSDRLNHASLIDACRLSRADVVAVPHRDVGAVEAALRARPGGRAVVATDAVFSVDGDSAPLADLHTVCRAHGALLLVDEAHALGVVGTLGQGGAQAAGLAGEPDVVLALTLSKSLGSQGGAVLGSALVTEHLVSGARSFIFDTALAPAAVGAATAALALLRGRPDLPAAVRDRARELALAASSATTSGPDGWAVTSPDAAVVSVLVGDPGRAVAAAAHLLDRGVRVGCFRPPSVPDGVSRLRLTARADLSASDLALATEALAAVVGAVPAG